MNILLDTLKYSIYPQKISRKYRNFNNPLNIIILISTAIAVFTIIYFSIFSQTDIFNNTFGQFELPIMVIKIIMCMLIILFSIVTILSVQLFTSFILFLSMKFLSKKLSINIKYAQCLVITSLSSIPLLGTMIFNGCFFVVTKKFYKFPPTSISYYLQDFVQNKWLDVFQLIDVFLLWYLILSIVGVLEVSGLKNHKLRYGIFLYSCIMIFYIMVNTFI
ncbi:hypothetical protein COO04_13845 [Bacillus toyonensis]|uniref:YIP1 family protein n=1 Tax=Bacillus toyonensis TaxID=155322 RepID=UPI000BEB5A25|nr:YIP1 family protein [Bacillus toyonensis]PEG15634.1 hypothetical protein COO04_13845 [Bacillus toyonensis]